MRRKGGGRVVASIVGLALVAGFFGVGTPAQAAFPGTNGLIAYVDDDDSNVYVVNPSNPFPIQVTNTGDYGIGALHFNAAGTKIAAGNGGGLVILNPVAGSSVTVVPNTTSDDFNPAFDPTGTKLAFTDGNPNIFTIGVDGTNRTLIINDAGRPDWSADGSFIAYHNSGGDDIRRANPNGGAVVVLATEGSPGVACTGDRCKAVTISPNSQKVAYGQDSAGNGIFEVNADGTTATPRRITNAPTEDEWPSYSPDGTKISFQQDGDGLATVPTDGSTTTTVVGTIGDVEATSWAIAAGTGTGTGTGTGPGGSVISVTAARNGANCVFSITATPAAAGITVDFAITSKKGVVKLSGNDVSVPASPTVKAKKRGRKKVRIITLSDPKGATLGTATATCEK